MGLLGRFLKIYLFTFILGIILLALFYPLNTLLPEASHSWIPDALYGHSFLVFIQRFDNIVLFMALLVPAILLFIFFEIKNNKYSTKHYRR